MQFFVKKLLFPTLLFFFSFLIIIRSVKKDPKPEDNISTNYTLKSYKNTVALYNNDELLTIYDNIVLNTLPEKDIQNFNKGIPVSTPLQAEIYLEDFE